MIQFLPSKSAWILDESCSAWIKNSELLVGTVDGVNVGTVDGTVDGTVVGTVDGTVDGVND